jgi:hypothetical protein
MKKLIIALVLFIITIGSNYGHENQQNNGINVYTVFVNIVNEQFRFPLIGFANIAGGSHNLPQIGFFNWNQNNFGSLQLGFINTVGGNMTGLQTGFVNTVTGDIEGSQLGFVNTAAQSLKGTQVGFINTATEKNIQGLQLGFVNTAVHKLNGAQISFFNIAKQLKGFQFGFVNYAESIENGMPIGFISIVRNGGYKAIELSISEISPINVSFKIGIEKLYTSIICSYNPMKSGIRDQILWGVGLGSIISINDLLFLNPELVFNNGINENYQQNISFVPYLGLKVIPNLSVLVGPSIVWARVNDDKTLKNSFFHIIKYEINNHNSLFMGARIAFRLQW